jgi:hypothetical protein
MKMKAINASYDQVIAVPTPAPTVSWRPVSHKDLLESLNFAVGRMGLEIRTQHYTLVREGQRLFGAWELSVGNGAKWMLGFRQGLDKSMAIGITAGTYITVCSNMMFAGDFVEFRMHTSGLTLEGLRELAVRALDGTLAKIKNLMEWQNGLKQVMISANQFKALTYDLIDGGVVMPSSWEAYHECVKIESGSNSRLKDEPVNLYAAHGGATRMLRGSNMGIIQSRTAKLNDIVELHKTSGGIYTA